jgi:hypothetical protein
VYNHVAQILSFLGGTGGNLIAPERGKLTSGHAEELIKNYSKKLSEFTFVNNITSTRNYLFCSIRNLFVFLTLKIFSYDFNPSEYGRCLLLSSTPVIVVPFVMLYFRS